MSEPFAPEAPAKLYKLRNAGGIESWFSESEARALLSKPEKQWTTVEVKDEADVTPVVRDAVDDGSAPDDHQNVANSEATDGDATDTESTDSAPESATPKKPKKARNAR